MCPAASCRRGRQAARARRAGTSGNRSGRHRGGGRRSRPWAQSSRRAEVRCRTCSSVSPAHRCGRPTMSGRRGPPRAPRRPQGRCAVPELVADSRHDGRGLAESAAGLWPLGSLSAMAWGRRSAGLEMHNAPATALAVPGRGRCDWLFLGSESRVGDKSPHSLLHRPPTLPRRPTQRAPTPRQRRTPCGPGRAVWSPRRGSPRRAPCRP